MSSFSDVAPNTCCAKAVAWAVENGIVGGTDKGVFRRNTAYSGFVRIHYAHETA